MGAEAVVPPTLSPPTRRFYPVHGVNELFMPWQAGVCLWPLVWCQGGRHAAEHRELFCVNT